MMTINNISRLLLGSALCGIWLAFQRVSTYDTFLLDRRLSRVLLGKIQRASDFGSSSRKQKQRASSSNQQTEPYNYNNLCLPCSTLTNSHHLMPSKAPSYLLAVAAATLAGSPAAALANESSPPSAYPTNFKQRCTQLLQRRILKSTQAIHVEGWIFRH